MPLPFGMPVPQALNPLMFLQALLGGTDNPLRFESFNPNGMLPGALPGAVPGPDPRHTQDAGFIPGTGAEGTGHGIGGDQATDIADNIGGPSGIHPVGPGTFTPGLLPGPGAAPAPPQPQAATDPLQGLLGLLPLLAAVTPGQGPTRPHGAGGRRVEPQRKVPSRPGSRSRRTVHR